MDLQPVFPSTGDFGMGKLLIQIFSTQVPIYGSKGRQFVKFIAQSIQEKPIFISFLLFLQIHNLDRQAVPATLSDFLSLLKISE